MIKTMNSSMTTKYNYQQANLKKQKQLEQEQNQRNGDHMEGYQWVMGGGRMGENVQGIRSISGRYKIERGRLRIV